MAPHLAHGNGNLFESSDSFIKPRQDSNNVTELATAHDPFRAEYHCPRNNKHTKSVESTFSHTTVPVIFTAQPGCGNGKRHKVCIQK